MTRTLLIDADILAFQAAAGTENVFYFSGDQAPPAVDENLEAALRIAERDIEAVANRLKADKVIVCLTDDDNFRLGVYPQYKSNRAGIRRPSTLKRVKDFYAETYECYQRPGLEADDCMGILATSTKLVPGDKIIVSTDKDMQTIPGLLFNPKKDKAPRVISEVEADRYFMQQTLTGDATDGYPGCRGVGPKSKYVAALAEAKDLHAMWDTVLEAYEAKGFTEQDAIVQARCARILRHTDWDFQARKPRLWTPPLKSRG